MNDNVDSVNPQLKSLFMVSDMMGLLMRSPKGFFKALKEQHSEVQSKYVFHLDYL